MNQRHLLIFGLLAGAVYWIWRSKSKPNELQEHLKEQNALHEIGQVSTGTTNLATQTEALTTWGDSPFAGIIADPFNPNTWATLPKSLVFAAGTPNPEVDSRTLRTNLTEKTTDLLVGAKTETVAKPSLFGWFAKTPKVKPEGQTELLRV